MHMSTVVSLVFFCLFLPLRNDKLSRPTYSEVCLCTKKTAPQFIAIRHCVWARRPGERCVRSHPVAKQLSTLSSTFQQCSLALATVYQTPTERNTTLHSPLHVNSLQISSEETSRVFLYIVSDFQQRGIFHFCVYLSSFAGLDFTKPAVCEHAVVCKQAKRKCAVNLLHKVHLSA